MNEFEESLTRRELRSPRAAAIAGIVYSLLIITVMVLTDRLARIRPEDITRDLLETWAGTVSLVILFIPFAGIAFLYFTGVIRDRLREREDRFFATLFLGSGIILVVLWFLWGAILGALMRVRAIDINGLIDSSLYVFGSIFMNEIIGNYSLRMAGLYMTAIGTLWARTKLAPRWLIIITDISAAGFLVAAERFREARFIFPVWVLVVSIHILVLNFRRTHNQGGE